jgi:hypothetical protein
MAFGPARPPITEDVAEVIIKDVKGGEGRTPTSEVPIAFIRRDMADGGPLKMNSQVRWLLIAALCAVALLVLVLLVR